MSYTRTCQDVVVAKPRRPLYCAEVMATSFPPTVDNDNLVRLACLAEAVSEGVQASSMMRCNTTS